MRFLIPVAFLHDDDTPAADVEMAASGIWGELYHADDADPVEYATHGAAVVSRKAVDLIASALEVGSEGIDADPADPAAAADARRLIDAIRDACDHADAIEKSWKDAGL